MESFGALLQQYNSLIDDEVKEEWGIPESWSQASDVFWKCGRSSMIEES